MLLGICFGRLLSQHQKITFVGMTEAYGLSEE